MFENVDSEMPVNAKKKKRGRCGLCGDSEQWRDIGRGPPFILLHMGFGQDGRSTGTASEKKYGKGAKINDPASSVGREKCTVTVFQANRDTAP